MKSFVIFLSVFCLAGCLMSTGVQGSGKATTEDRTVGAFSSISVEGAASVDVEIGANTSVTITTDDNLQPLILTQVENTTLRIYSHETYNTSVGVNVKITTPTLDGVSVSGACSVHAVGLDSKHFALSMSGAGSAKLMGQADALAVNLSGAGSVEAGDLKAKDVQVEISGVGSAVVYASQSLSAAVSGAGSVRYKGNPAKVQKTVSGVGSISSE